MSCLTWVVSPATGFDLQPQTRTSLTRRAYARRWRKLTVSVRQFTLPSSNRNTGADRLPALRSARRTGGRRRGPSGRRGRTVKWALVGLGLRIASGPPRWPPLRRRRRGRTCLMSSTTGTGPGRPPRDRRVRGPPFAHQRQVEKLCQVALTGGPHLDHVGHDFAERLGHQVEPAAHLGVLGVVAEVDQRDQLTGGVAVQAPAGHLVVAELGVHVPEGGDLADSGVFQHLCAR